LSKHPGVKDTAVLAWEDQPGNKRLVGYWVARDSLNPPSSSELHQFLKKRLPDYMIPAAFVCLDAFPLTSSGKIDRRALPAPEVSERLIKTDLVEPRTPAEKTLVEVWGKVLAMEEIGIHDNFFELGGDSILSIQVVAQANQKGLRFTPRQLFQYQTIAELATVAGTSPVIRSEQGLVKGAVALTPIQRWFFAQDSPQPHHANQAVMLQVVPDIRSDLLQKVLLKLLLHHDALRMRFVATEDSWEQRISEPDNIAPYTEIDLAEFPSDEQIAKMELVAAQSQAGLNLIQGPLMKAVLFRLGPNKPARLLLIIHHLVIDGVSWRILLEDLATAYRQLSQREPIQFPPKTTSFKKWARRLVKYGQSEALQSEVNYWVSKAHTSFKRLPLDCPYHPQANTEGSIKQVLVSLTEEETGALLQDVPSVYNTQINDVLLTALALTFSWWTGEKKLLVDLEGHGRENLFDDVDISRTVGWFTTVFPVSLEIQSRSGLGETLKMIKEQLREIPNQGIGYGLLRYISQNPSIQSRMRAIPQSEISFNYLGQLDQTLSAAPILGMASESTGPSDSPLALRSYLLEINGYVSSGKLHVDWTYSENLHDQNTINRVVQEFIQSLRDLIAHCQSVEVGDYTPSDFPEAELNQKELDQLLVEIGS
jgi:non-ribosomal peptide synthase protein (TIGR01720 family)